eukprot:scaffold53217_cov71-Phaeocystis_antarctica.AAC.5
MLLEGGDQLCFGHPSELRHHPARTGHVEHDTTKVLSGGYICFDRLARRVHQEWAALHLRSARTNELRELHRLRNLFEHGLCVVEFGHGWLIAATIVAVRVSLEDERARKAAVQLGHDDTRAACEGTLEQPHLQNGCGRAQAVACAGRCARLACAVSRGNPPWSSTTTERLVGGMIASSGAVSSVSGSPSASLVLRWRLDAGASTIPLPPALPNPLPPLPSTPSTLPPPSPFTSLAGCCLALRSAAAEASFDLTQPPPRPRILTSIVASFVIPQLESAVSPSSRLPR